MQSATLGTSGESVSALCLGTMYFGSRVDEETSWDILDTYYEAGGRFLDTANIYATWVDGHPEPESEPLLGEWLDERGVRKEMVLATKVGFGYGDVPRSLAPDVIEREVEKSLERLGVEYVDLLYAHVDDYDTPQVETMEAFQREIDAGRVRHLGASNFFAWRLQRANHLAHERGLTAYCCVQPRYSYLIPNRGADFGAQVPATDELIDYSDRNGLTVLPYSPLLQGCYGRDDRSMPEQYVNTENRVKMDLVQDLAEAHDANGNQIVLAWMRQQDRSVVPVFGVSTREQLEQNLASLDVDLSDDELARLDSVERLGAINR